MDADELTRTKAALLAANRAAKVRRRRLTPSKPMLKAPEIHGLKLKHDDLLSSFAFKFNLRRYIKGVEARFNAQESRHRAELRECADALAAAEERAQAAEFQRVMPVGIKLRSSVK